MGHALRLALTLGFALRVLALSATPAHSIILPASATLPRHVTLVCSGPNGPDSATGHVFVVIYDQYGHPLPSSAVYFDFTPGLLDLRIANDQQDPRLSANCQMHWVVAFTNAAGRADLTVLGGGRPGPAQFFGPALQVYADGVPMGRLPVAVLDRDGSGSLDAADLSLWGNDFFAGANPPRADLDGDGVVGVLDLSQWAGAFFSGNDTGPALEYCP
jgi:hypothetical protein